MDTSAIPWVHAAAFAGTVYAYGVLSGSSTESLLLLAALAVQGRRRLAPHLASILSNASGSQVLSVAVGFVILAVVAAVFRSEPHRQGKLPDISQKGLWTGPGKPLLLPCITTHTRLFPKTHSFVYSYLVVGVPVGWTGVCNGMVSVAGAGRKKGWYHIDAEDYLERGNGHLGLRGKLDAHLVSQGADPALYPHAYLVTAAKFLGYHFNPISFWYLYNEQRRLAAMVLEVNNTFGERRMYYLTPENTAKGKEKAGETLFKQTWSKDFHVSPFNSRKGSYELLANDPLAPNMEGTGPITATVVLRSSHMHRKIVARLLSERHEETKDNGVPVAIHAQDPAAMNLWHKVKFLAAWWWVGFATFPRILKHAGILFLQKRLHVWIRPEPLAESMGRLADATEKKLEAVFRLYLRHLVENAAGDQLLAVKYVPSGVPEAQPEVMLSPAAQKASGHTSVSKDHGDDAVTVKDVPAGVEEIEFRVLTPVFYTRFVHYAHDVEALFCELRESGTVSITPQAAPALFAKRVLSKPKLPPPLQVTNPMDFVMFKAIQKLRHRPDPIQRPMTFPTNKYPAPNAPSSPSDATSPMTVSKDLRGFRLSAMDGFVLSLGSGGEDWQLRWVYRTTVLSLFLADRLAFGSVPLLQLQWLVVRAVLAWFVAQGFLNGLGVLDTFNMSKPILRM